MKSFTQNSERIRCHWSGNKMSPCLHVDEWAPKMEIRHSWRQSNNLVVTVHWKLETSIVCKIYIILGFSMLIKMAFVKKSIWRRTKFRNAKCHDYNAKKLKVNNICINLTVTYNLNLKAWNVVSFTYQLKPTVSALLQYQCHSIISSTQGKKNTKPVDRQLICGVL